MAQDKLAYEDRITVDPTGSNGRPVVKGARVSVELVLDQLSRNPDLPTLFAAYPSLTVEDVKAVLAYAKVVVASERNGSMHGVPSNMSVADRSRLQSPREFYEQVTGRDDVREILSRLAK